MALDIFNLAGQAALGGAINVGRSAINNLASSAIGALGGSLMGGSVASGLIMGNGNIPDFPCGMGSAGCSGWGSGLSSLNDPCGRFNDSFNNGFESIGLNGARGAIDALGGLALGGTRAGFGNAINGVVNNAANSSLGLGVSLMGNLGAAAAGSLITAVGNASLSDAGSWLDRASDSARSLI